MSMDRDFQNIGVPQSKINFLTTTKQVLCSNCSSNSSADQSGYNENILHLFLPLIQSSAQAWGTYEDGVGDRTSR